MYIILTKIRSYLPMIVVVLTDEFDKMNRGNNAKLSMFEEGGGPCLLPVCRMGGFVRTLRGLSCVVG